MDLVRRLRRPGTPLLLTWAASSLGPRRLVPRDDYSLAGPRSSHLAGHLPSRRSVWKVFVVLVLVAGIAASALSAPAGTPT